MIKVRRFCSLLFYSYIYLRRAYYAVAGRSVGYHEIIFFNEQFIEYLCEIFLGNKALRVSDTNQNHIFPHSISIIFIAY